MKLQNKQEWCHKLWSAIKAIYATRFNELYMVRPNQKEKISRALRPFHIPKYGRS